MGKIIRRLPCVKRKLEDFHSRETAVLEKLKHTRSKEAQILRNDLRPPQLFLYRAEKIHAGSRQPLSVYCSGLAVRDRVILVKSPEVIDPYHIIELQAVLNPADPPLIPCLFMILPIIQRISPELSSS